MERTITILKKESKTDSWDNFFNVLSKLSAPYDFLDLSDRNQSIIERDPFKDLFRKI
ncbi:hypothetical protein [Xenorhabdus innexi]|uniref:Virulence protein n=1 Tax=Xenorhabdus innexi TaxID=290109 RepID=A0A1N6MTY5_9GAMM